MVFSVGLVGNCVIVLFELFWWGVVVDVVID